MTGSEIIETLRHPGNRLPREALAEVARRKEEFIPVLIAEIESATRLGGEADLGDLLSSFAMYLLAQFREPRALEPILEYFALDEKTDQELFGDMITESGAQILAAVGHENPARLREYAKRKDISRWVRGAALDALVLQSLWGEQSRESVVEFFLELFSSNEFGDDDWEPWMPLAHACIDLHPREFLESIRNLYDRGLVDEFEIGSFEDVEREAAEDPEERLRRYRTQRPPITDTAEIASWWQVFEPPMSPRLRRELEGRPPVMDVPAEPVRSAPKIGRNDLCPCGSGKKYKKCCLAAG